MNHLFVFFLQLVALIGLLATAGCDSARSEAAKTVDSQIPVTPPPLTIEVAAPVWRTVQRKVEGVGALFAKEALMVSSKLRGAYVTKMYVEFGDAVKKGQVLAEMDTEELVLQVGGARAALAQAQASFLQAEGEYRRAQELFQEQIIAPQRRDAAEAAYGVAKAQVRSAEKALAIVEKRLRDGRVISPVDGYVQQRLVSVGQALRPSSPLFEIVVVDPLRLRVTLAERWAAMARIGLPFQIQVDALPGQVFTGFLTQIAPAVDPGTRSLLVVAEFPNPQGLLRPGYFARVTAILGEAQALCIPRAAVVRYAGVERIFVITDNTVKSRVIKSGTENGDFIEIAEGLAEHEQVAVTALERLADGLTVQIQQHAVAQ